MQVSITLPDDIAHHLEQQWGNLQKAVLEMVTVEAHKSDWFRHNKVRHAFTTPPQSNRYASDVPVVSPNTVVLYAG